MTTIDDLKAKACRRLGHRTDTPCQADLDDLLGEALEQLDLVTGRLRAAEQPAAEARNVPGVGGAREGGGGGLAAAVEAAQIVGALVTSCAHCQAPPGLSCTTFDGDLRDPHVTRWVTAAVEAAAPHLTAQARDDALRGLARYFDYLGHPLVAGTVLNYADRHAAEAGGGNQAAKWVAFPGEAPVCQDCGADWKPLRRGECQSCGSDAGPHRSADAEAGESR